MQPDSQIWESSMQVLIITKGIFEAIERYMYIMFPSSVFYFQIRKALVVVNTYIRTHVCIYDSHNLRVWLHKTSNKYLPDLFPSLYTYVATYQCKRKSSLGTRHAYIRMYIHCLFPFNLRCESVAFLLL